MPHDFMFFHLGCDTIERVLILSTIVLEMSTRTGLADLLFGRTRGAILALLYGHADRSFYTRQIAREVNASVGAVQRELENLSKVLLIDGLDTTSAAYEVGYESVSQF